ncbi:divalent-cation tolerance protein CutA [Pelagicoccus mobilis]|uniref:Divalent-cation tolerance protein CutA n=1 Tax=Pelagicoccus mobilis TaxID=415221 RepID=A0A934RYG7_9BACT|nr:divalent-cation tolerance protein CutA [Pelagicoccus mobilis]MBK1877171.1 divalent-cation tolerance protein CutA [Pelagicoccus mobilis]
MSQKEKIYLCLTTVSNKREAQALASQIVEKRLAACVQLDSPVTSFYRWKGKVEQDEEIRMQIFAPAQTLDELTKFVTENHPYDTPKWICIEAEKVSEKYLKWANEVCNLRGFI